MTRRAWDDVPTVPIDTLLDLGAAGVSVERTGGEGQRAAKVVAHARCPGHADPRLVGVVWDGGHYSWREHQFRTWTGTPFTCGASLQRLCDLPARDVAGEETPTCPCRGE